MKTAWVVAALVVALALQTTAAGAVVDLVLIVVVTAALSLGPGRGLMAGMIGGVAQDALSGGILGVGGVAKTVAGFLAGLIGSQLIVSHAIPRFFVFGGATLVAGLCYFGIYGLLPGQRFAMPFELLRQAGINGLAGVLVFRVIEGMPGMLERRRARRGALRR